LSGLLLGLVVLRWREALGCEAWPVSRGEALLEVVDWDQRFRFPTPSGRLVNPSAGTVVVAALLGRLRGGVVALLLDLEGSGFGVVGSLSLSDADRLTAAAADDEDMELLRDDWRRAWRVGEGGAAASDVWIFMVRMFGGPLALVCVSGPPSAGYALGPAFMQTAAAW
jgi:hypothetical protein